MRDRAAETFIVVCLLTFCAMVAITYNPARSHDIYHDWKTESGVSCCNDQDCAPVRAQFVDDHWEIWHGNVWRIVPDRAVRPIKSPDGRSHACVFMGNILCFVPGEVRS